MYKWQNTSSDRSSQHMFYKNCLLVDVFISSFSPLVALEATQFNRYKGSIYLVFDFCDHDLAGLLSNANVKFTLAEIKKVMQMLLNGLYYIHRNKARHWFV